MVDIYLQQLLKIPDSKTKFDLAYEKFLDEYVDSLEIQPGDLSSMEAKKTAIKEDIKKDSLELDRHILSAITFLTNEGAHFQEMQNFFNNMREKLEKLDPENDVPEDMIAFFEIETTVLLDIAEIGLKKYLEGDYSLALSCFVLLTFLEPDNPEYWYKEGIAAQKCEKYDLALVSYAKALQLNPDLLGAQLFSCQCYLETGQQDMAKELLNQVKALSDKEESWNAVIERIEGKLINSFS